jgi:hypothetical protein
MDPRFGRSPEVDLPQLPAGVGRIRIPWEGEQWYFQFRGDGIKFFRDLDRKEARKIIVSVKGGGLKAGDVRALNHAREREGAEIALFISLEKPTAGMIKDAASAGFYTCANKQKVARVQLLNIEGLLSKTQRAEHPDYEPDLNFKKAAVEKVGNQAKLDL